MSFYTLDMGFRYFALCVRFRDRVLRDSALDGRFRDCELYVLDFVTMLFLRDIYSTMSFRDYTFHF